MPKKGNELKIETLERMVQTGQKKFVSYNEGKDILRRSSYFPGNSQGGWCCVSHQAQGASEYGNRRSVSGSLQR